MTDDEKRLTDAGWTYEGNGCWWLDSANVCTTEGYTTALRIQNALEVAEKRGREKEREEIAVWLEGWKRRPNDLLTPEANNIRRHVLAWAVEGIRNGGDQP